MFPEYAASSHQGRTTPLSRSRTRLLKSHDCPVPLPDGTDGTCRYERLGPACHRFTYHYQGGALLARLYQTRPLENTPDALEAAARQLAPDAFAAAIEHERRDHFARATLPTDGSRTVHPATYRLRAGRAKRLGGRYALCRPVGRHLVPVSLAFDRLSEGADLWRTRTHPEAVLACCCRLDRRWELLRYNPLLAEGHPRREEDGA